MNELSSCSQQMFLQSQTQSPLVGQFVQTESGLVWQPTSMYGSLEATTATALPFPQATGMSNTVN